MPLSFHDSAIITGLQRNPAYITDLRYAVALVPQPDELQTATDLLQFPDIRTQFLNAGLYDAQIDRFLGLNLFNSDH